MNPTAAAVVDAIRDLNATTPATSVYNVDPTATTIIDAISHGNPAAAAPATTAAAAVVYSVYYIDLASLEKRMGDFISNNIGYERGAWYKERPLSRGLSLL